MPTKIEGVHSSVVELMADKSSTNRSLLMFALNAQGAVQACNLDKKLAVQYFESEAEPAARKCILGMWCREK